MITPASPRGLVIVFNPSDCYYLLCRAVRTSHPRGEGNREGNRARGCPPYIKIKLSLSIVGRRDDSSIANMRVLGAVGSVPRGGLTRSVELDMSSSERTGGPPVEIGTPASAASATSTSFPPNSHYSAKGYWISPAFCALPGVFIFFSPLPRPRCHHGPWGSGEPVHAVQRTGVLGALY